MYCIAIEFHWTEDTAWSLTACDGWDIARLVLQEQHLVNERSNIVGAHVAVSELDAAPLYIELRTRVAQLLRQFPCVESDPTNSCVLTHWPQFPCVERDVTNSCVLAHWFDLEYAYQGAMREQHHVPAQWMGSLREAGEELAERIRWRDAMLPSQWMSSLREYSRILPLPALITRELRMAQSDVNETRWADEEMRIALRRRGAGSTTGRGWLVPSNSADARAMLEDIRTDVLCCQCNCDEWRICVQCNCDEWQLVIL